MLDQNVLCTVAKLCFFSLHGSQNSKTLTSVKEGSPGQQHFDVLCTKLLESVTRSSSVRHPVVSSVRHPVSQCWLVELCPLPRRAQSVTRSSSLRHPIKLETCSCVCVRTHTCGCVYLMCTVRRRIPHHRRNLYVGAYSAYPKAQYAPVVWFLLFRL